MDDVTDFDEQGGHDGRGTAEQLPAQAGIGSNTYCMCLVRVNCGVTKKTVFILRKGCFGWLAGYTAHSWTLNCGGWCNT